MRISVIIPGFNNPGRWWRRCVESVIATGADEVICVDDGSQVRPEFLKEYPVRTIFREVNGGLSIARNTALGVANGDYIAFVDADDEVRPEVFRRCIDLLETSDSDVAIYGVNVVWPEDGLQKTDSFDKEAVLGNPAPDDVLGLHGKCLLNYSCNKVYRRSFLEKNSLRFDPDGMPCEDIIFNLSCLMSGAKVCLVPYVGYVYYRTRGTLLSKYKATQSKGVRIAADTWKKYKESVPGARTVLGRLGETDDRQETLSEWRNIWLPGSPYGLVDRWRWLCRHPHVGGFGRFVRTAVFTCLRRHCYWRCVRRWNTRRNYPNVVEWRGDNAD